MKEHNYSRLFAAVADPTRRGILALLARGSRPAGAVASVFPQQRPAVSKHLGVLKRAGLISEVRVRQQRIYAIDPDALDVLRRFLDGLVHAGPRRQKPGRPHPAVVTPAGRRVSADGSAESPDIQAVSGTQRSRPAKSDFNLDFD